MKLLKNLTCILFLKLILLLSAPAVHAQQLERLAEMMQDEVLVYMLDFSGTVLDKSFDNVQAIMTISVAPAGNPNPYVLNIFGYPQINERNSFVWYSQDSYMTYLSGSITCRVKYSYLRQPGDIYFFYPSPVLYESVPGVFISSIDEEETAELAEKVLLPTKVTAQDGKLDVYIHGNRVSGRVWIKGYDSVENSYVQYAAQFRGRTVYDLETKRYAVEEPHPMHILERIED